MCCFSFRPSPWRTCCRAPSDLFCSSTVGTDGRTELSLSACGPSTALSEASAAGAGACCAAAGQESSTGAPLRFRTRQSLRFDCLQSRSHHPSKTYSKKANYYSETLVRFQRDRSRKDRHSTLYDLQYSGSFVLAVLIGLVFASARVVLDHLVGRHFHVCPFSHQLHPLVAQLLGGAHHSLRCLAWRAQLERVDERRGSTAETEVLHGHRLHCDGLASVGRRGSRAWRLT